MEKLITYTTVTGLTNLWTEDDCMNSVKLLWLGLDGDYMKSVQTQTNTNPNLIYVHVSLSLEFC